MKNLLRIKVLLALVLSVLLLFTLSACGNHTDTANDDTAPDDLVTGEVDWDFYTERATSFLLAMAQGHFDEAYHMLDSVMAEALHDADIGLEDIWASNIAQAGTFLSIYETDHLVQDGFYCILITSEHEISGLLSLVALTEDGLVGGLQNLGFPILEAEDAESARFTEYPIVIGAGTDFPLDGMLSMPSDVTGQVPAAIILGGSGIHNMDGLAAGLTNRIHRDIAEYLAENGIAVIRYDRRLYAHTESALETFGGSLTVREEVIEDVLLAVELLRTDPRIDSDRIYLIGHSLGGMLAPRIHAEADFAGLILMAATPRHMLEMGIEQLRASVSTAIETGMLTEADLADLIVQIDLLDDLFDQLADIPDEKAQETPVPPFGATAYYFKDMALHPFADYIQGLTVPILVMQGSRDFQILADVDFVLLQELFTGRSNVTFRLYTDLNHSFMPTTAENFIEHAESVMLPGHVYIPALQDIADWILGQ